jgi:hypothetical protein
MNKKKCFVLLLLASNFAFAQDNYLWPVEGKKAGEGILYKPQSYIGQELNANNLIIAAPLKTNIFAPVEGTITMFNYVCQSALNYSTMYGKTPTDFHQDSLYFVESGVSDVQFLNLAVGIQTAEGTTVYLEGLRPSKPLKTGQKVQRGEVIGTAGYFYKKINGPCISIEISKRGVAADPMKPFGLKTTFQAPDLQRKTAFTKEEATEDYNILIAALKEGFPDLYDYVSEAEFERATTSKRESFGEIVSSSELEKAICFTTSLIRDSHTALMNPSNENPRFSTIDFGIQGDSMIVTRTGLPDGKYLGKRILTVDGIPCDSMKALVRNYFNLFDGFIESYPDFEFLCMLDLRYCHFIQPDTSNYDVLVKFANGETKLFKGGSYKVTKCFPRTTSWQKWYLTNQLEPVNFRMISDTTAYLGIRNFDLNQVEVEQVREHFVQMVSDSVTNLIIDLRNNGGGDQNVMAEIYSYFAQEPFRQDIYQKVNKRGNFDFFRNSSNHIEGQELFSEYEPSPDGDGFFLDLSDQWHQPDSTVNYKRKVYLLVNERSCSASAVFAGWVKKQWRGAIVGRETGSTYHQMKAIKFEDLMLPNSKYIIHFPLVKTVMDTVVSKRFPYGRGVLPDYEVKLTLDELSSPNDSILEYTQQLIREGKYIYYVEPEPETLGSIEETGKGFPWLWVAGGGVVVLLGIAVLVRKNR